MPGSADEWMSIVRRSLVLECNSPKYVNCEVRDVVGRGATSSASVRHVLARKAAEVSPNPVDGVGWSGGVP